MKKTLLFVFAALFLIVAVYTATFAQEDTPAPEDSSIYVVPNDLNPEELMGFLNQFISSQPRDRKRIADVFEEVANRILAASPNERLEMEALKIKRTALLIKVMEAPAAVGKFRDFIAELEKNPKLADFTVQTKLMLIQMDKNSTKEEFEAISKTIIDKLKAEKKLTVDSARIFMGFESVGEIVSERFKNPKLATDVMREFIQIIAESELKSMIPEIEGGIRRIELVGNEMKIEGVTLGGEPFNWKSLRGKVILVDFWATWCGPCLAEVPNMLKQYEKYKEKGFEILGISVDRDVDALKSFVEEEKTPWIILSETLAKEKGIESTADYYGINGIPRMILVDREGKVISINARGEELNKLLEKAFE